jgi:hypothetical protein
MLWLIFWFVTIGTKIVVCYFENLNSWNGEDYSKETVSFGLEKAYGDDAR